MELSRKDSVLFTTGINEEPVDINANLAPGGQLAEFSSYAHIFLHNAKKFIHNAQQLVHEVL